MALGLLLTLHLTSTAAMTGLVWFVQVVHYPLLGSVDQSDALLVHRFHVHRSGLIIAPLMLLELGTAVALLPMLDGRIGALAWLGIVLLVLIWASTFVVQVPLHRRLTTETDSRNSYVRSLIRTNWFRTGGWTLRTFLALVLLTGAGLPAL